MNAISKKIIQLGMVAGYGRNRMRVFCKIEFGGQPFNHDAGYLSISGVEGPNAFGGCRGSCGQIDMHLRDHQNTIDLAKGWTRDVCARFFEVWKEWHLKPIGDVPADVIDFLRTLPDTDRTPAWV